MPPWEAVVLIAVSVIIGAVGGFAVGLGHHKTKDEPFMAYQNQPVTAQKTLLHFYAVEVCRADGLIKCSQGPVDCEIIYYGPGRPVPLAGIQSEFPRVFTSNNMPTQTAEARIDMAIQAGVYGILFGSPSGHTFRADVTLSLHYLKRPWAAWIDRGMNLLTLAIPLLITGIVLYLGGSLPQG